MRTILSHEIVTAVKQLCIDANCVLRCDTVEALRKLTIVEMPVTVLNDLHGGDLYEEGRKAYRRP